MVKKINIFKFEDEKLQDWVPRDNTSIANSEDSWGLRAEFCVSC